MKIIQNLKTFHAKTAADALTARDACCLICAPMNSQSIEKCLSSTKVTALARLGLNHGYRFDGDNVCLNAMFTVLDASAHTRAWALQLWACPQAPLSPEALLGGHLIAQAPLPPIGEVADDTLSFEVTSLARTPAVAADHVMVLALVAAKNGRFDEVHDFSAYAARQYFLQPRMRGQANYQINDNRVRISVDRIENAREAGNISGTLSIGLWALSAPYSGESFDGICLAETTLGSIEGQAESTVREFDLPFTQPKPGTWHAALILREWTAAGFLTRDFINFMPAITTEPAVVQEVKTTVAAAVTVPSEATRITPESPVAKTPAATTSAAPKAMAPAVPVPAAAATTPSSRPAVVAAPSAPAAVKPAPNKTSAPQSSKGVPTSAPAAKSALPKPAPAKSRKKS